MASMHQRRIRPTEYLIDKKTILIVDDEMGPRESLRMILTPAHDAIVADCAAQALEILRTRRVDLVTVDLNMPGMKGDELMRIIRQEFPGIEVVIITGCSSVETAVEGIRYGVCDYLLKPFDVIQVNRAVDRALDRQQNRHRLLDFLEGIGLILGKDEETRDLLVELSQSIELQIRLRAAIQESLPSAPPERAQASADRTSGFLEVLAETIESRDPALRGHARRVSFYCGLLAERLSLGPEQSEHIRIASFLHDLGKVGSGEEDAACREHPAATLPERHPETGERLIRPLGFSSAVALAIRHHHECWDGSGYPDGLCGDEIPLASRIIALSDAFDGTTTGRSNRGRPSASEAAEELEKHSGSRFDPRLVKEFLSILESGICNLEDDLPESNPTQAHSVPMSVEGDNR